MFASRRKLRREKTRTLARASAIDERLPRRREHFERALEVSAAIGAPPHVARTSVDYARMLLTRDADGDAARARALLADASSLARELGMQGLIADIDVLQRHVANEAQATR